jgi:chromosomal replication initiator protein
MSLPPRIAGIVREVAAEHHVRPRDVLGPRRFRKLVRARWDAMARIRALTRPDGKPPSYPQIGEWLGGRDHTTVMHGLERLAEGA